MALGSDLLALPFAEVVAQLATGIAEAQQALDRNTVERLLEIARTVSGGEGAGAGEGKDAGAALVQALERLKETGLLPTFYQFLDTEIEVRMAISTAREQSLGARAGVSLSALTVDATYAQKYGYRADGASVLRA
ncbi:MAG TPA: hypothetical protein VFU47_02305, partial [Armatimonadota bacterium]|nr:hypothetical protein [Armatimonadota bacterium]